LLHGTADETAFGFAKRPALTPGKSVHRLPPVKKMAVPGLIRRSSRNNGRANHAAIVKYFLI
jgi:hypothetical protein